MVVITLENEQTHSFSTVKDRGGDRGRWWWSQCWQGTTTLKNKPCVLIFESGCDSGGSGIGKEQPPTKTSMHSSFSRVMVLAVVMCSARL